ncbi:MAG: DUF2079 domain-containing protein [Pseudomonadota bacterium]
MTELPPPAPEPRHLVGRVCGVAALAYAAGALVTVVALGRSFRHEPGFVAELGRLALWPWLAGAALAAWVAVLHQAARQRHTVLVDAAALDRAPWLASAVFAVALTAPLSAYASHLQLPALAVLLATLLSASAWRLAELLAPVRRLAEHRATPWVLAGLVAGWYFFVTFYRHHQFGSGSRDMGLFFQSVWLLSTGRAPLNTLIDIPSAQHAVHAFGDHLELVDLLMVPLVWIWRDAGALLLGQALVVGSGVVAVVRLARRRLDDAVAALLLGGSYALAYPVAEAVQFDWNPTTLATGFLAWAFCLADEKRYRGMAVALFLTALCKENLLLYVAAFGLFLVVEGHGVRLGLAVGAGALFLFGLEIKLVFPLFREGGFRHFYFRQLGGGFGEVALSTLRSPLQAAMLMLTPGNKVNGLLLPFSSTAWLCLLAPAPLIVALPALGERFLADFPNAWWGHHYGGPSAAIAVVAAVHGAARLAPWLQPRLAVRLPGLRASSLLAAVVLTATILVDTVGRWNPTDLFVLEKPYLPHPDERPAIRAAIRSVPDGVPVAAQNYLVAHLAAREQIYELDEWQRAQLVVLDVTTSPWPYDRRFVDHLARQLARDPQWGLRFCERHAWVFERGRDPAQAPDCPGLQQQLGSP